MVCCVLAQVVGHKLSSGLNCVLALDMGTWGHGVGAVDPSPVDRSEEGEGDLGSQASTCIPSICVLASPALGAGGALGPLGGGQALRSMCTPRGPPLALPRQAERAS